MEEEKQDVAAATPQSPVENEAAAPMSGADAAEEVSVEAAEPPAEAQVDAGEFLLTAEQPVTVAQADAAALKALVEAVVYVLPEPLPAAQIAAALNQPLESVQEALRQLMEEAARPDRGVFVREVAGGYQVATKPEHHEAIRNFVKNLKQPLKLSTAALETLAVIAYKQPVTAPEILEIRGVQGVGVLKTLLERKLITTAGRKNVIGKPILYTTTKEFLTQFGLMSLAELPTLKEFEEIRRQSFAEDDQVPSQEAPSAGLLVDVPALDEPEPAAESQTEWPAGAASETPTEAAPDVSAPDVTAEAEAPRVEDDDAGKRDG